MNYKIPVGYGFVRWSGDEFLKVLFITYPVNSITEEVENYYAEYKSLGLRRDWNVF